jgi:hypothetical protein
MSGIESIPCARLRFDHEETSLFRGKFPSHTFFENDVMHTRLHRLKLKDALSVFDGVITRDAKKFVAEESKSFRVVRGDPLFTSGSIFP